MEKVVFGMALTRFLSASIEFSAAVLMLYFGRVEAAFRINSLLACIGPVVMLIVTALGLAGLAGKISLPNMLLIVCGVCLIFYGLKNI
ncbi:MAG: YqhV family protein [Desulfotomaculales bacterium]